MGPSTPYPTLLHQPSLLLWGLLNAEKDLTHTHTQLTNPASPPPGLRPETTLVYAADLGTPRRVYMCKSGG